MIPAAGIQDQELAITAKRSGVNYPTVAWRRDLRAAMTGDRQTLLGSTGAVGATELANPHAVDRQVQVAARGREGDSGREPARIVERGDIGPAVLGRAGGGVSGAIDAVESRLEFGDQVLEAIDLAGEIGGMLALVVERLFGRCLLLLPLVDEQIHAQLLEPEHVEIA